MRAVGVSLRFTFASFVNEPVTLLVSLAAILLTSFLRCVIWGCDLRMDSGLRFFVEHIAPGLIMGFLIIFFWQLRRTVTGNPTDQEWRN